MLPNKPNAVSATNIPGGERAELYLNGDLIWIAGGGTGAIPTYAASDKKVTTSTALTIYGGKGSSNGSNGYITYHTCGGNSAQQGLCYNSCIVHRDTIAINCVHQIVTDYISEHIGHSFAQCEACGYTWYAPHPYMGLWGHTEILHGCGTKYEWRKNCGHNDGDLLDLKNPEPGTCYHTEDWEPASALLSNTGSAKFVAKLCEQQTVLYKNTVVKIPYYQRVKCNLIIKDNTVCYYKR